MAFENLLKEACPMNSQTSPLASPCPDEAAVRDLYQQMMDAWNEGNGEAYAAQFVRVDLFGLALEGASPKDVSALSINRRRVYEHRRRLTTGVR
jgi:hypothetical protein